jgi:hypothetical protein
MIPRAKKPKKKSIHKPTKTPYEYVKATNFLNISAMVRTLATVYDWSKEQIDEFMESHMALLQEISDHRCNIKQFVKDTEELTGVNITKLIDRTCEVIEQ